VAVKKLLRTIRFDETDPRVFARAAEAGEYAVPGAFAFAHLPPEAITGKVKQAFANGFFGLTSFGHSTFATVGEISDDEEAALVEHLARYFVEALGAPDFEAAVAAACDEIAFSADLCREMPINTVFTVRRVLTETGEMKEEFRTISPPSGEPAHARVWTIEKEPGDGA
jgi:hypothetical protein